VALCLPPSVPHSPIICHKRLNYIALFSHGGTNPGTTTSSSFSYHSIRPWLLLASLWHHYGTCLWHTLQNLALRQSPLRSISKGYNALQWNNKSNSMNTQTSQSWRAHTFLYCFCWNQGIKPPACTLYTVHCTVHCTVESFSFSSLAPWVPGIVHWFLITTNSEKGRDFVTSGSWGIP